MTPTHQETHVENSPADKARGEESLQVHLLSQVTKKQKSHTILLYGIFFVLLLQAIGQHYNNKASRDNAAASLDNAAAQLESTKAQTEATKARLEAEKAHLEADKEYYESVGKSFDFLYTRLNQVERACSQPNAP